LIWNLEEVDVFFAAFSLTGDFKIKKSLFFCHSQLDWESKK